jgi:hypothetical protein
MMTFVEQVVDNSIEEYMTLIRRTDELIDKFKADKEGATPEDVKELDERLDDIEVIRKQLITHVKTKGISREILDKTGRLLSIF